VKADAETGGAPPRGPALRIVATKLRERQVGEKPAQLIGGVRGESGLQPVLVLGHREVALCHRLAQLTRGPLAVAVAGSYRCGDWCGRRHGSASLFVDLDTGKFLN
jgi:hypothetical protein